MVGDCLTLRNLSRLRIALYYGAVKHGPQYQWLDIQSLLENLCPHYSIDLIRYYTAEIELEFPTGNSPFRQLKHLQALEASPKIRIQLGTYSHHGMVAYCRLKRVEFIGLVPPTTEPFRFPSHRTDLGISPKPTITWSFLCFDSSSQY